MREPGPCSFRVDHIAIDEEHPAELDQFLGTESSSKLLLRPWLDFYNDPTVPSATKHPQAAYPRQPEQPG